MMKMFISVIKGRAIHNAIYKDIHGAMKMASKEEIRDNDPPIIIAENRWEFGTDEFNKALAYAYEVRLRYPGANILIH